MEGLKRFYDQNRKGIWIAVIVIALFVILLQLINSFVAKDNENKRNSINLNTSKVNTGSKNVTVTSGDTSALGESLSTTKVEKDSKIISTFFDNLNNEKFEDAFNMLTDECKEEMFSTVDELKEDYYNNIFGGERKSFEVENWVNNIYKVDIVPDMLATGKSNNGEVMQDHITIDDDKLNINNYIGRTKIDKSKEEDGVKITVNYKDAYMDYEKYYFIDTNMDLPLTPVFSMNPYMEARRIIYIYQRDKNDSSIRNIEIMAKEEINGYHIIDKKCNILVIVQE